MSPTSTSTARRPGQPRAARGATMVEYAVLLVAVLLIGAGSIKLLGTTLGKRGAAAGEVVSSAETDINAGAASPNAGGGGTGAGAKADGKASVATKMGVSGIGGAAAGGATAGGAAAPRDHDVERGPPGDDHALVEGFSAKRWLAAGLLLAGLVALGFVIVSVRRAKLAALATSRDGGPRR